MERRQGSKWENRYLVRASLPQTPELTQGSQRHRHVIWSPTANESLRDHVLVEGGPCPVLPLTGHNDPLPKRTGPKPLLRHARFTDAEGASVAYR